MGRFFVCLEHSGSLANFPASFLEAETQNNCNSDPDDQRQESRMELLHRLGSRFAHQGGHERRHDPGRPENKEVHDASGRSLDLEGSKNPLVLKAAL